MAPFCFSQRERWICRGKRSSVWWERATLPIMVGMVTSLSGIFFIAQIESKTRKAIANVEDELPLS